MLTSTRLSDGWLFCLHLLNSFINVDRYVVVGTSDLSFYFAEMGDTRRRWVEVERKQAFHPSSLWWNCLIICVKNSLVSTSRVSNRAGKFPGQVVHFYPYIHATTKGGAGGGVKQRGERERLNLLQRHWTDRLICVYVPPWLSMMGRMRANSPCL